MITIYNQDGKEINVRIPAEVLDEALRDGHAEHTVSHGVARKVFKHSKIALHTYARDGSYIRVTVASFGKDYPSVLKFSAL